MPAQAMMAPPGEALTMIPEALHEPLSLWWERAAQMPALAAAWSALPGALRDELPRVVAGSEFVGAALIQDPGALAWLGCCYEPDRRERPVPSTRSRPPRSRPRRMRSRFCASGVAERCCASPGGTSPVVRIWARP